MLMKVRISVRTEITLIENHGDDSIIAHKPVVNAGTEKDQTTPASLQFVRKYKCIFNPAAHRQTRRADLCLYRLAGNLMSDTKMTTSFRVVRGCSVQSQMMWRRPAN